MKIINVICLSTRQSHTDKCELGQEVKRLMTCFCLFAFKMNEIFAHTLIKMYGILRGALEQLILKP